MRMNATCRNLHMCKQYEIFTSYKIAKKDRYCWIMSLIQNRNSTSDAALVWVYPAFKVQVSFLEWRWSYIVKQWRPREILKERSWVVFIKYLDLWHPYLCISKLEFARTFTAIFFFFCCQWKCILFTSKQNFVEVVTRVPWKYKLEIGAYGKSQFEMLCEFNPWAWFALFVCYSIDTYISTKDWYISDHYK